MDTRIQALTNILFRTEHLQLQCSVPLFAKSINGNGRSNEPSYCSLFNTTSGGYLAINPGMNLKLKYVRSYTERYSNFEKTDYIYINQKTINYLIAAMGEYWKLFQREDLFMYDHKGFPVEINMDDNRDIITVPMDYGQYIRMQPCIYYQDKGKVQEPKPTPGIMIMVNVEGHNAPLSIEEFKELHEVLKKVDFNIYPQLLIQNFLLMKACGLIPDHSVASQKAVLRETSSRALQAFMPKDVPEEKEYVSKNPVFKEPTTLEDLD